VTALELTLVSAFLVGFIGSTHCIGMCGGIVGALTLGAKRDAAGSLWSMLPYLIAYNLGRVTTYAGAGAVFGFIGAQVFQAAPLPHAQLAARLISGGFMVALGFYLTGWWSGLAALERIGGKIWRRIEPLGRRLLPVNHSAKAFLIGLLWGWLPCGMVYAALAWSLSAGGGANGAALMAAFGLGTMPMLFVLVTTLYALVRLTLQNFSGAKVDPVAMVNGEDRSIWRQRVTSHWSFPSASLCQLSTSSRQNSNATRAGPTSAQPVCKPFR